MLLNSVSGRGLKHAARVAHVAAMVFCAAHDVFWEF